jgi:hypothetical protein
MAYFTGTVTDYSRKPLNAVACEVTFTANGPSLNGSIVLTTRSVTVTPDANGFVIVNLAPTATLYPAGTYYTAKVSWLDSAGNYIQIDHLPWKLHASSSGGSIAGMIDDNPPSSPNPDGMVNAPTGFGWASSPLAGRIFKSGGLFTTTLDAASYKLTGGKAYYVDVANGLDTNAGTLAAPYKTVKKAHDQTDVQTIFVRATGIYVRANQMNGFPLTKSINIIGYDGTPLISNSDALTWALTAGKTYTYQATRSNVGNLADIAGGLPGTRYVKKTSIAEVEATPGSYFPDATIVYVRTIDGRAADANILALIAGGGPILTTGDFTTYLENIDVVGGQSTIDVRCPDAGVGPVLAMKNVRAGYSTVTNVVNVLGAKLVVSQNCEAFHGTADGFNYHIYNGVIPKAIEINCRGYSNGGGTSSDNGSSAHDGSSIIRVNGQYFGNVHSNVADVHAGTQSWNLGCAAYTSGVEDDFTFLTDTPAAWLDSCAGFGSRYGLTVGATATVKVRDSAFSSINGTTTTY